MTEKHLVINEFQYILLEDLEYKYSLLDGGYISKDMATIVINNRRPYNRQVMQFSEYLSKKHLENIEELRSSGFLEGKA